MSQQTAAGGPQVAAQQPAERGARAAREALANVLEQMTTLANGYGRDDLAGSLGAARERLKEPNIRVLIVGEYKKGKSSLVNGILAVPVAPVDDDIATSVPTIVRYGDAARAVLTREPANGDGEPTTEDVPVKDLPQYVSEIGNPGNLKRVRVVEVWLPRKILQTGLVLVDTPGVGGLGSVHTAATLATLPTADAVVFVTDSSQELTAAEVDFLKVAERSCPNIVCVLTKTDLYPEWRRILEIDQAHLLAAGVKARIIPLSSVLRQVALKTESKETNAESGYLDLIAYLRDDVLGRSADITKRAVVHASIRAVEQLEQPFAVEREVLGDPERAGALTKQFQEAKDRAEQLRGKSSRWQQTLADGFGDLQADVDHDLRQRMREATRVAEEAIDQSDPADSWEEFRTWLNQRVTFDIVQNFSMIAERARVLADEVADHFESEEDAVSFELQIAAPSGTIESIATPALDVARAKMTSLGFTALRQAYSNVAMFSMFGNMANIALGMTNPITLMIGLLSGGKAIKDAKQQQLTGRRQQAKTTIRRYIDDVNFHVGKDFRDTIRHLQRNLRDTFSQRADELQRSTTEALTSVQQAAQQDQAHRQQRLQTIDAEMKRLSAVKQKLVAMMPAAAEAS